MRPSAETDTVFGDRLSLVVVAAIAAVLVRSCVVDGEAIIDHLQTATDYPSSIRGRHGDALRI